MLRGYDAAQKGRRGGRWSPGSLSVNEEHKSARQTLRDRSRDLVRNNPYTKRAIEGLADNLIGTGIRPAPINGTKLSERKIKKLWNDWADRTWCDYDGKNNLYGLQHLAATTLLESGEVLVIRRRSSDSRLPIPIQLQVLEGDYIDTTRDRITTVGGGEVRQGVEFDGNGRRVAYWLYQRHPGDGWWTESRRVPVEDVLHIYPVTRPGQIRGVPVGTSSMVRIKDFDEYEDAQLMRQKIAACLAMVVSDDLDQGSPSDSNIDDFDRLEPGAIIKARPGQTITTVSPPAADGYDVYTRTVLRAVAAGYGVTYEMMTGDLSNVNFSSARMGWIEFSRLITRVQELVLIPQMCTPLWDWFLDAAVLGMQIREGQKVDATWTSPRREMIDPSKEVRGMKELVRSGFGSWQEIVRQLGYDPDEVLDQLKKDKEAFEAAGLAHEWSPQVAMKGVGAIADPKENEPE